MKTEFPVKLNANLDSYAITNNKVWLGRRVQKLLVKLKKVLSTISELIMRILKAQEEYEKIPELEQATPVSKIFKKYFENENLIYQMTDCDKNTKLAEILSQVALDNESYRQQKSDLNKFLKMVVYHACEGNKDAERALRNPNVSQTPLCFLAKMGNGEGARCILPLYEAEDLFSQTLWGNTVLHLAVASGQKELAVAIMQRADELEALDQLLSIKNKIDFTADEVFQKLMHAKCKKALLKDVGDFFDDEEMAQALIGKTRVSTAKRGFSGAAGDLKNIFQSDWYRYSQTPDLL